VGRYHRQPLRGFRKFAMVFWDRPRDGTIYGHLQMDVSKTLRFIDDVNAKHGIAPSMGQVVGRGIALAATKVPEINGKIIWGRTYLKDTVDMYFQVDVEDGKDLSGVTVPDAGRKTIVEIATLLRDRANKLRGGKDKQYEKTQKGCLGSVPVWMLRALMGTLTFLEYNLGIPATFLGAQPEPFGTLMLTNVSKFGVDVAYAPLVPVSRVPMVALMGQTKLAPWVVDGQLTVRPVITVAGTFDHRLVDGNKIGKFITAVKAYVENPYLYETEIGVPDPDPPPAAPVAPAAAPPPRNGPVLPSSGPA
jgi:pyruvate/2-oxoglutarate dehydrogenase complex dihydrolipoamide acyltransferase (E2) component